MPKCLEDHEIGPRDYYYVVNPKGGYGMDELLCCEKCILLPQNFNIRLRMIEAGAKELADIAKACDAT